MTTFLKGTLEIGSYQPAWAMLHRLRSVLARPGWEKLAGVVEVNETYVGGAEARRARPEAVVVRPGDVVVTRVPGTNPGALAGVVDPPERAWTFGGYLRCDGHDPEGNPFQLREAVG